MNRLVYSVFKTLAMSILFIFAFDIIFYMYRVMNLNSRIESIATSMKKVVMENNYMPKENADIYSSIFKQMVCDFNGVAYYDGITDAELVGSGLGGQGTVNTSAFISGMHWNYDSNAVGTLSSLNVTRSRWTGSSWQSFTEDCLKRRMDVPAAYGDVMVIQIRVGVFQPLWGWTSATGVYRYNGESADAWVRSAASTELVYTYYVPCLNYRTVTY